MVLQEPINGGFGHKAALRVREVDSELTRRQVRLLKGQIDGRRFDLVRDLVPDPPWSRLAIRQSFAPALLASAVPAVERRSRGADCRLRPGDRGPRTVFPALSGTRLLACLIVAPQRGYDEPGTLSYAISSFCPTSADGLQWRASFPLGTRRDRSGWCQFSRQAVVLCVDEKSHIQALERTPKRAFVQDSLSIFIAS